MANNNNKEDFYQTLGLPRGGESITQNEIKRAYHKCALKYHPDKHANSSKADRQHAIQKFKEVNRAFEVLRDQEKRNAYDSPKNNESFTFSFGADFDEFQMFHQFMREEFMFHMSRGGRIYQGSSDDTDEDYSDDDDEEEFYYSYDDYDYIYEGDYPESAEQRRYDENKRRYEAKLARRKANKKKEKKGKPFTEMTDAEIDAFWDNNNAKEEEANSKRQAKTDGQGKRSAKSKKQKALQAKKEAKLKKLQRKQELERRNAELKKQEKANNHNNLDTSSSATGGTTTTSKKKKKKKKKKKDNDNNNSNSTTDDNNNNNKEDTKTSMKKNSNKNNNTSNKNNNLTTDSDEDEMDEQSNNKNESDYNNRNTFDSGFIKQEANIFILDKEKLQQIVAMGFPDTDLNATALFESNNNVELALEIILKKTAKESKRKASQESRNNQNNYAEKGSHDKGLPKEEDRPINYKSKLCQNVIQGGTCRYGMSCHYAHSKAELRKLPPRPKDWNKEKDLNGYDDNDNDTYSNQSYGSNSGGNKSLAKTSPIKINSPNNKINNSATPSTKLGGSPSTSANNWASKLKSSPVVTKGKGTTGGLINNDSSNLQQQRQQSQPRPAPQQVNNNNIQLEFDNNSNYNRNINNRNINNNNNRNNISMNNNSNNNQWGMSNNNNNNNKVQAVPPPGFNNSVNNNRNINNNNNPINNQANNSGWGNINYDQGANDTLIPTGLNASLYDIPDTSSSLFSPEPQPMVNMGDDLVLDLSPSGSPDRAGVNGNNPLYNNSVGNVNAGGNNNINNNNAYNSSQYDANLPMHNNQYNQHPPPQQKMQQQQPQQENNLIGAKISLVDGRSVRYEGILAEIRVEDGAVVLQSVISFGTEDRLTMSGPVPGSNQMYNFMVFNTNNIRDLQVINDKQTILEKMKDTSISSNNMNSNNNAGMSSYASQIKQQPQQQQPRNDMYRNNGNNNNMSNGVMDHNNNNMSVNSHDDRSGLGSGGDASKYPSSFVFVCNNRTEEECIGLRVFANTKNSFELTKRHISLGSLIFLVNFESRKIQGVFQAASVPQLRIAQNASFTARFPVQVRVYPVQPLKAGILPPGPHRFGPSSSQRTKAYLDILGISIDEIDLSPENVIGVYDEDSYKNDNRWDNDRGSNRRFGHSLGPLRCEHCAQSKNARIRDVVSKTHRTEDCRRVNVNKNSMRR